MTKGVKEENQNMFLEEELVLEEKLTDVKRGESEAVGAEVFRPVQGWFEPKDCVRDPRL